MTQMNANVAVTEARVEPITGPRDRAVSVHSRSSAAKMSCLRRWVRRCGASRGCADVSGFVDAVYWSGVGSEKRPAHGSWDQYGMVFSARLGILRSAHGSRD